MAIVEFIVSTWLDRRFSSFGCALTDLPEDSHGSRQKAAEYLGCSPANVVRLLLWDDTLDVFYGVDSFRSALAKQQALSLPVMHVRAVLHSHGLQAPLGQGYATSCSSSPSTLR
eukprot:NODE_7006_length_593_cov_4.130515_g6008_i0.p1 GENE.NODE_7006_length_593_cov_4.130515_g6008_i0~~NODE_7006_length_593_cov_4.130515_g6008_i0.p1  ORF type:complete len:114 (+),score=8.67 NODE_7006_length_593_cov_4.130515_g6008_i0:250-591(+)